MRLWYISPAYLDPQRLLAAHQENHALLTCVRKGRQWGIVTETHKTDMLYPQTAHNLTVLGMGVRKGLIPECTTEDLIPYLETHQHLIQKHNTNPRTAYLVDDLPETCFVHSFKPTLEHLKQDCLDLRLKWTTEEAYFGPGRICLCKLERELGLPVGPSREELLSQRESTLIFVKENKKFFDKYRELNPKSRMQDRIKAFRLS